MAGATVTDRHKEKPLSIRLGALRAWVDAEAARTGKPVRRVILDAIQAAKDTSREDTPGSKPALVACTVHRV